MTAIGEPLVTGRVWVRLDANIYSHDKILALLEERNGYRAALVYIFSIAWSGNQGTEGYLPKQVLPIVQGTTRIAALLVAHKLWMPADDGGWWIRNWDEYQPQPSERERLTPSQRSEAARRAANARWHPDSD